MRFEIVQQLDNQIGWFISINDVSEKEFIAIENVLRQFGLKRVRRYERRVGGPARTGIAEDSRMPFRHYKKRGASFYSCFLRKVRIVFIYWKSNSLNGDDFASLLQSNSQDVKSNRI